MRIKDFLKQATTSKYQQTPSPEFRSIARTVYFGLHFVLGFFVFYLLHFSLQSSYSIVTDTGSFLRYEDGSLLKQIQDSVFSTLYRNSFEFKSASETLYLIFGVIWGSLGWDRLRGIKTDLDDSSFFIYFVIESGVGIALLGFITSTVNILNQVMKGIFREGAPTSEVFLVCTLGALFILTTALLWTNANRRRLRRENESWA